ncbi:hypothetical protein [Rubrivivax albus]|uniref:Uncharacterized protein n=1 Tax=Rubrivivax albus TaxID=2499835 RepID=A0A3S2U156_9BURK|nr:hypothetical protein [Rubrivivax albus]RVT49652.1 hypothetical protein ENE75_18575 [Rubrivivax albus]
MTAWTHIGRAGLSRGEPFEFQKQLAARLVAVGLPRPTAHRVADWVETGAECRRVHAMIDVAVEAGAVHLVPLAVQHGIEPPRFASLLRAAGATDGRKLNPAAIDAVRRELYVRPKPRGPWPSPYLEGRSND